MKTSANQKCMNPASRAALRSPERRAKQNVADVAEARRRLKDPKRRTIPLARLKAELGL